MTYPHAERFAALASELTRQLDPSLTTESVVARALEFTPDADLTSLTVRSRSGFQTLAATTDVAEELDAEQYRLGEGPCIETAEQGDWVRSGDVGTDVRWPAWGPAAARRGVRSMLSIRLLADGRPFGALNHYARRSGAFADRDDVELALIYAVHAANALATSRLVSSLETAVSTRHDIGVAQGFLMATYGLSAEAAFLAMRRVSMDNNVKLRQVALDVLRVQGLPGASTNESS